MNTQSAIDRKLKAEVWSPAPEDRRLRKRAERRGVPAFVLRLMASRGYAFTETETTVRYRRD